MRFSSGTLREPAQNPLSERDSVHSVNCKTYFQDMATQIAAQEQTGILLISPRSSPNYLNCVRIYK